MESKEKYDFRIDALRGIAFLTVFIGHFSYRNLGLIKLYKFASYGVVLFFCLSGYLLGRVVFREFEKTKRINILNFFLRRALRILPLYFIFLTLIYLLSEYSKGQSGSLVISGHEWIRLFTFTYNIISADDFGSSPLPAVTWSLSIEEQIYVFFPFFALFIARGKRIQLLFVVSLLILALVLFQFNFNSQTPIDRYTALYLPSVMIGLLCARCEVWIRQTFASKLSYSTSFMTVFLIVISLIWFHPESNLLHLIGILALSIIFPIILKLGSSVRVGVLLKLLGRIGRISFGCYLYHWIIWNLLQGIPSLFNNQQGFSVIGWVVGFALTLISSFFSYRLVETPFLNLRRRFQVTETS